MPRRTPEKWRALIQRSLELQKERRDEAARFKRGYTGDYSIKGRRGLDENKDEISVNFVYTYIETVRPTIMPGTPRVFVQAESPESEASETHSQAVLNHFIRVLGLKTDIKLIVEDWFYAYAAVLSEWEYKDKPVMDGRDPVYETDEETGEPLLDSETGEPIQKVDILADRPRVKRVDPWDVVLDPDSKSRKEDRWRALRQIMTVQEFYALPTVTKEMKKRVRGRTLPPELVRQPFGQEGHYSSERNWVILWNIYDLENEMVYKLVDGESIDFFVEEEPWPWEMEASGDRFPVTVLEGKQDGANPYPFSVFKAVWSQIQERNKLRMIIQSSVRRSAPGWVAKKGIMDEEQKAKFVASKIGELCEANGDPAAIIAKPMFGLNPEFFAHDKTVGDDLVNVSGLIEYNSSDSIADTATEASILDSKANIRKGEGKSDVYDFLAIVFSKMLQLCQQFLQTPVAIRIKQPDNPNAISWLQATGDHIQGEFSLKVQPGDDDKETEGLYRQQTLKFAELMANNPWTDQKKLAISLARVFRKDPADILKTDQQFQQDADAAKQAELAKEEAKRKGNEKPPLDFAPIRFEQLPPEAQVKILLAAMMQNGVSPVSGGGVPPAGPGSVAPPGLASPSMAGPPPGNSVLPGPDVNQTIPANASAAMPPANPVLPISEAQGGLT